MKLTLVALLVSLPAAAQLASPEEQESAIERATAAPIECAKADTFDPLFKVVASGLITGAHTQEELGEANDNAFLKCPYKFLLALNGQSEFVQNDLARLYFGISRPPWEMGAELKKWKKDPKVGALVRSRFGRFLKAKEPKCVYNNTLHATPLRFALDRA